MLELEIRPIEFYNEETNEFIEITYEVMRLEHSLYSISKWEEKWHKPYLSTKEKTPEEYTDYIKCMCLNRSDFNDDVFNYLSADEYDKISKYMDDPHTATTIKNQNGGGSSSQLITAELVYSWMALQGIPFECDRWNFNKLLTLILVCSEESKPKKKMSKRDILSQNHALNMARRR